MSATTRSPASRRAGGRTSGQFRRGERDGERSPGCTDRSPRACLPTCRSAGPRRPPGSPCCSTSSTTVSSSARQRRLQAGTEQRVDDQRADREPPRSASSHCCSPAISTTGRPRRPRISRFTRASPRTSASATEHEDRHVDTALAQRARDDEAVAAVVAAAAEHRHLALVEVREGRLDGRHHLAAGVLHQHERRHADLLDRGPVGLPHLCRRQDSHRRCYCFVKFAARCWSAPTRLAGGPPREGEGSRHRPVVGRDGLPGR